MELYALADNIISPLGFTTDQNFNAALNGQTGIKLVDDASIFHSPFYGGQVDQTRVLQLSGHTYLERLFIQSITDALQQINDLDKTNTVLILSSTKGNIDLLDPKRQAKFPKGSVELFAMASAINHYFELPNQPVVVSNACISGVSALLTAQKLIRMGKYEHAVVTGGDLLTAFTVSGFQSLMAIDDQPCRPYDEARKGINLGEACATMVVSEKWSPQARVKILGGAQSNDANHISGPSRTGEGLKLAVEKALIPTGKSVKDVDYINAHGTATAFNDEMEAIAFNRLELNDVPLNSMKGYFGHTLGAAGILESIMAIRQMNEGHLLYSKGYEKHGVSKPLNILKSNKQTRTKTLLKTVSGFGGCNAAIVFEHL